MLICHLPEDILAIVLGRCVRASGNTARGLKCNLPVLAVCRLWRHLAIPLVYSQVFVQYGDHPKGRANPSIRNPNVEEPAGAVVKTNLGLVGMVGCARTVKQVQIDVYFLANPFPGWRDVIQRMCGVARKWRVAAMMVTMHPDSRYFDGDNVDVAKYVDDIIEVSDALAALMPDVCRLKCGGFNRNPIARSLYGRLAGHYADQLWWFDSRHPIVVPLGCQFTRLKRTNMSYDQMVDYQLPQMAAGEFANIRLVDGPPNHSWASFSTDSDSRVIEFTELKRLSVAYFTIYLEEGAAVRHRDGHPWKLYFPSLRRLDIHNTQSICPLLEYAVLPPRMESISIHMASAAYLDITNVVLPATKHLSLGITMGSLGDTSGVPAINRILDNTGESESLELTIEDPMLPVGPETFTCSLLTHLKIAAPTSVDSMLALIGRLPNLVKLTLHSLNLADICADISIPEADGAADITPLSLSLERLDINYFDVERISPDTAVAVVKHVLLRTPALVELNATRTLKTPVTNFVQEYATHFPHLSSIKLKLY